MSEHGELALPWLPEGRVLRLEGRGEVFVRLHRHADADAPVVVLLHGWTASSDLQFVAAYEALAERCTFVGIDERGHGRGIRSPAPFSLEDAADDAAAVIRQLGLGPVIVVGYSMGGPIAMHLTRRHPALVRGLVVQATALEWRGTRRERAMWRFVRFAGRAFRSRGYRRAVNRAMTKWLGGPQHVLAPYVSWLVAEMSRGDAFAMVDAGRALSRYDARPWAGDLGVPAASLITTKDRLVPPRKQRQLAEALGATVRELPGDHLAALVDATDYSRLTVELIELVAAASSARSMTASPPAEAGSVNPSVA